MCESKTIFIVFLTYKTIAMVLRLQKTSTLEYLINVQEVINMQAGKISKIDKRAGGNKAVQVGIFQKSIVKNHKIWKNFKNK